MVKRLKWKLGLLYLEIVLILMQDRYTDCMERHEDITCSVILTWIRRIFDCILSIMPYLGEEDHLDGE